MIGVDANVLLRLFVADDEAQHRAALEFFAGRSEAEPAYVCLVVLLEFVWSLGRTYRYSQETVSDFVARLLDARDILFEREEVIVAALRQVAESRVGFPDAVIALKNAADGCGATVTFDRAAARRLPHMELLA